MSRMAANESYSTTPGLVSDTSLSTSVSASPVYDMRHLTTELTAMDHKSNRFAILQDEAFPALSLKPSGKEPSL